MNDPIYLIEEPKPPLYARYSHVGTWTNGRLCKACGQPTSKLVEPLKVEWEVGDNEIGDFSWCGYTTIIGSEVKSFLELEMYNCHFGKVEIIEQKSKKKRVPSRDNKQEISWLLPIDIIDLNLSKSGVSLEIDCSVCLQKKYNFKRDGLIIDEASLRNSKIFRIKQFERSAATFVTYAAMQQIKNSGFTNIFFTEVGRVNK